MRFTSLNIDGAWSIEPERLEDERGWFARVYCEAAFAERQMETHFPQHSLSFSREEGTLRGLSQRHQSTCLRWVISGAFPRTSTTVTTSMRIRSHRRSWSASHSPARRRSRSAFTRVTASAGVP